MFGSAESVAADVNGQTLCNTSTQACEQQRGGREPPLAQADIGFHPELSSHEVVRHLKSVQASQEELRRAVQELQVSFVRLEPRVSELEVQWQHQAEVGPNFYDLTPRVDSWAVWHGDQTAQDESSRDGEIGIASNFVAVPNRVPDLATLVAQNQNHLQVEPMSQSRPQDILVPVPDVRASMSGVSGLIDGSHAPEIHGLNRENNPPVVCQSDSDVYSFLAGAQPARTQPQMASGMQTHVELEHGARPGTIPDPEASCGTSSANLPAEGVQAPPGLEALEASPTPPSSAELSMLLKALSSFLSEFPKLELGDVSTRAQRLLTWKVAVLQAIIPCGHHLKAWWKWTLKQADVSYREFIKASVHERESILPTAPLPAAWEQIDSWMRPKLIEASPKDVKEWVNMRARQGTVDDSHVIVFYLMKLFGPGSPEEKVQLLANVLNPNVCSQPRAAQVELLRWKETVRRLAELGCHPPDMLLTYRAMESIFSAVFDKSEPLLNARWISLRNGLGLPHKVEYDTIVKVAHFASSELGALVLHGGTGLNTGLPLTDNQRARQQQLKDSDKKRAAAAKAQLVADAQAQVVPPVPTPPATAAGARLSATTSIWAKPCTSWKDTGVCSRGISCRFSHSGFPVTESRCITCGRKNHTAKQCTAPGGGADPNREQVWEEYRKRKAAGYVAKGKGDSAKGKGQGKSDSKGDDKSKGDGRGKGGGKSAAKAAIDNARASAATGVKAFPRSAIGLDSWANVHLIHQKRSKNAPDFQDSLTLAHGKCRCRRETGRKGVPRVYVPWVADDENIDLFPEGFLWDRGCTITKGKEQLIQTPKDRVFKVSVWGTLPYISKEDLQRIIDDLPDEEQAGRTGVQAETPTAARVCRNLCTPAQVREQLKHLKLDMARGKLANVTSKYRNLPDVYYGGDSCQFVTPEKLREASPSFQSVIANYVGSSTLDKPCKIKMWEWYCGSATLSSYLREQQISHLPPIDYRYGWNLSKREHQVLLLDAQLTVGVQALFASPNCAPWGSNSRSMNSEYRIAKREEENPTLLFLAVACFFQVLLNRKYLIENSAYSDIFHSSPLRWLRDLPYNLALLDQCAVGGCIDGQPIRKRTHFQSSHELHHLQIKCPGGHSHMHLRGGGRAASSAQYTTEECHRIMLDATMPTGASEGGSIPRITTLPDSFATQSFEDKVAVLEDFAHKRGYKKVWDNIVTPWLSQQPVNVVKAGLASEPPAAASSSASSSGQPLHPVDSPPIEAPAPVPIPVLDHHNRCLNVRLCKILLRVSNLANHGKNQSTQPTTLSGKVLLSDVVLIQGGRMSLLVLALLISAVHMSRHLVREDKLIEILVCIFLL